MKLSIPELKKKAWVLRRHVIRMIGAAGSGHPGGSLSAADIVAALYFRVMRHDPRNPKWPERDRFVLSKGHACPVLYAALAEARYFPREWLLTLRKLESPLQGHPHYWSVPGIEASTGSLGQGISIGNGMALAARLDGRDYRIYVMIGDGECDEGQVWEAAMAAAHYKLDSLSAILDHNGLQIDGPNAEVMNIEPIAEKWRAFGWHVVEIDGHDFEQILDAFEEAKATKGKPTIIIANTIKGKGVSFMENQVDWHGKAPSPEQVEQALKELGSADVKSSRAPSSFPHRAEPRCRGPMPNSACQRPHLVNPAPGFSQARLGKATRDAYGEALVELGHENPDIVVLDADLSKSTRTKFFAKEFPDRFFDFGVAEANMMGTAAGLASCGKIPFASTFAVFAACRDFDQVRMAIAYSHLNVKIVASHSGISVGADGPTHHSIEDVALACSWPGFVVIVPADEVATRALVKLAAEYVGPVYIRLGRSKAPIVYEDDCDFAIGRANVLREGDDVAIIADGLMVAQALEAAQALSEKGIEARVLDMHTVKPLDREAIVEAARGTAAMVVAEEHLLHGGLGSRVAQVVAEERPVPMEFVALRDTFAESGKAEELFEKYGLTAADIVRAAERALARKEM